jgi:hypothetical protein
MKTLRGSLRAVANDVPERSEHNLKRPRGAKTMKTPLRGSLRAVANDVPERSEHNLKRPRGARK